jgi:ectoine hydroxylase-related dioxygenase (phytanoyl-CoA dioxygenase family)
MTMKPENESIAVLAAALRSDGMAVRRRAVGPEEVADLRREADALFCREDMISPRNLRTEFVKHDGASRVNKYDPVTDISAEFAAASRHPAILEVLQEYWGEAASLFKDKLIFKIPGHEGFGPHQDHVWWRPFPTSLVTVSLAIDSSDRDNGALEVAPGYHRMANPVAPGILRDLRPEEAPAESAWRRVDMEPGDLIFFSCLTPHRSGPNRSCQARRMLHLTYNPTSAGDLYLAHYRHLKAYMVGAGQTHGDSVGNGYVPEHLRREALFYPLVKGVLA